MAELATLLAAMRLSEIAEAEIARHGGDPIPAPRSWTKDEQALFGGLDPQVKAIIARREANRETALRRAQNDIAEQRNELNRLLADAATKAANGKDETQMAKGKGVGAYTTDENPVEQRDGHPDSQGGKNRTKTVDSNSERSDGFSAKLTPTQE